MENWARRLDALSTDQRRLLALRLGLPEDAAISGTVHREDPEQLLAWVVRDGAVDASDSELRQYVGARLPEPMQPAAIVWLDSLPLLPNGKVDRSALPVPQRDAFARTPPEDSSLPRGGLERQLSELWLSLLGIEGIGREEDFFELGGHSLLALRLVSEIEARFGVAIPLAEILELRTIRRLARRLQPSAVDASSGALVPIRTAGTRTPLFCVHCGGGSVLHYEALARHLGGDWPVYGLQPPAFSGIAGFHRTIEEMAVAYADVVQEAYPAGPYLLCGYSFGGLVALEVARELRRRGGQIALLAVFDTGLPGGEQVEHRVERHRRALTELRWSARVGYLARKAWGNVRHAAYEVRDRVRRVRRTLPCHWYRLRRKPLPVKYQNAWYRETAYRALARYRLRDYEGTVTLFRQLEPTWASTTQPDLGWLRILDEERLRILEVPGQHDELLAEPAVEVLAKKLRALV